MSENRYIIDIDDLSLSEFDAIIDVRSPSEFVDDHIPGAINCPVLDDEQRARIGTLYVQVSPFAARKEGAVLTAQNIAAHIEEKFKDKEKNWKPLIYCWRGGQRSGSMRTVFRQIGWDAVSLKGGYKAYRGHVLDLLEIFPRQFTYVAIGGPTGSGKTLLLNILEEAGAQVLDLEALAKHKGSVLGLDPMASEQTQKSFDTELVQALSTFDPSLPVYVETESRKIGKVHLPHALYDAMKKAPIVQIDVPVEERIRYLKEEYNWCIQNPEELKDKLSGLKKLRGKEVVEEWFSLIDAKAWEELTLSLLQKHYDPLYTGSMNKGLSERQAHYKISLDQINKQAFSSLVKQVKGLSV